MRSAVAFAALAGAVVGFGGGELLHSRDGDRAAVGERAAPDSSTARFQECAARLDSIDARMAKLAAPAAAPARVEAEETGRSRIEERLAAIEAALVRIADRMATTVAKSNDPPRHAKDVAAVDRLVEVEFSKQLEGRHDHLGYTADRLYDRYGAPDYAFLDPADSGLLRWVYNESNSKRGVIFYVRGGVVVNEDPFQSR